LRVFSDQEFMVSFGRSAFCPRSKTDEERDLVRTDAQPAADEALRLATLRAYGILDSPPEDCFEHLVNTAVVLLAAPIGLISLVDERRVWFKARVGLHAAEMPREHAFCSHAMRCNGVAMVVSDARADPRFQGNPFVVGAPNFAFYAGVRLTAPNGQPIGTLCVLDRASRAQPDARQIAVLTDLAALTMEAIELRSAGRAAQETARINRRAVDRLHEAHRGLLAAYRAKSEFFASLSHELRTPLNAVIGYADLIARGACKPEALNDSAQAISDAGRYMLSLVNDILEFGRLEAGGMPIAWRQVPLPLMVEEALRIVDAFAGSHDVLLSQQIAWPDCMVRGDPVRLKQVLLNLLTNAIKFTPPGGKVRIRLSRDGDDRVALDVEDTGIGIAPYDIPKALTPFGQVVSQDGEQREGTGLGLPIAASLVERHGGSLHIESQPGHGTKVRILLPTLNGSATLPAS
jgi:signal transduction histidine kinase